MERKKSFEQEEDQLLIKRSELMIPRKYNYYRALFMAVAATFCSVSLFNTKVGLAKRLMPTLLAGPLLCFYNKNIGMYQVQRQIDDVFFLIVGDDGHEAKEDDCEVRRQTRNFMRENMIESL